MILYFYIINIEEIDEFRESLKTFLCVKIINISIFSFFSTEMTPVAQFLEVWRYIAIGVASLFLLWQMVAYVKFSHQWASSWYQASIEAKSSCRRVCWLLLIWTVSVLCLFGAVVSFIGMFYIYSETMRKSSNRKWIGIKEVLVIFSPIVSYERVLAS